MELIPEINMISDFEAAGIKCLQNPSLNYRFWKWGALFFAIFATFSSIIRKLKLVLIRFHTRKPQFEEQGLLFDFSDDDDDDDVSLQSSDAEDEDEDDDGDRISVDQDFRVKGGSSLFRHLGRRSCGGAFADFASGKSVVKIWEGLGFSLDFDEDLFACGAEAVVSTWDGPKRDEISGGFGDFPATVVLTAEGNGRGDGVIFGGYDTRMRRRSPALYAEWSSPELAAGVRSCGGGVGKVYVRDEVNGVLTVGDVRNVRRPLESGEESDGETWWDADAVIVD